MLKGLMVKTPHCVIICTLLANATYTPDNPFPGGKELQEVLSGNFDDLYGSLDSADRRLRALEDGQKAADDRLRALEDAQKAWDSQRGTLVSAPGIGETTHKYVAVLHEYSAGFLELVRALDGIRGKRLHDALNSVHTDLRRLKGIHVDLQGRFDNLAEQLNSATASTSADDSTQGHPESMHLLNAFLQRMDQRVESVEAAQGGALPDQRGTLVSAPGIGEPTDKYVAVLHEYSEGCLKLVRALDGIRDDRQPSKSEEVDGSSQVSS